MANPHAAWQIGWSDIAHACGEVYDPCCGSAGLLIKCELALQEKMSRRSRKTFAPAKLYGQEGIAGTWAMANMNMIIHDMEGEAWRGPPIQPAHELCG